MKFNKETQLYTPSATNIKRAKAHVRKLNKRAGENFYRCDFDMKNGVFLLRDYVTEYTNNDNLIKIV